MHLRGKATSKSHTRSLDAARSQCSATGRLSTSQSNITVTQSLQSTQPAQSTFLTLLQGSKTLSSKRCGPLTPCHAVLCAGHPNVVEIMGLFEDDTHIHIVEEMCTGGDLYRYTHTHTQARDQRLYAVAIVAWSKPAQPCSIALGLAALRACVSRPLQFAYQPLHEAHSVCVCVCLYVCVCVLAVS